MRRGARDPHGGVVGGDAQQLAVLQGLVDGRHAADDGKRGERNPPARGASGCMVTLQAAPLTVEVDMTELQALPALDAFQPFLDPVDDEVRVEDVAVEGELPSWLAGTLVRNGPAWFGEGDHEVRHLLDGLAMLHAFTFAGGKVGYANRFLRTKAYRAQREDGRIGYREFASDPCRRLAEPIASMFSPRMTDNASVNVIRLGEQLVALTETPIPIAFDLETLETLGVAYEPPGRGPRSPTAHPLTDPRWNMLV
ncbi:MAG: carotenoid oxygenase family protein [Baekduiaceae bacterium]